MRTRILPFPPPHLSTLRALLAAKCRASESGRPFADDESRDVGRGFESCNTRLSPPPPPPVVCLPPPYQCAAPLPPPLFIIFSPSPRPTSVSVDSTRLHFSPLLFAGAGSKQTGVQREARDQRPTPIAALPEHPLSINRAPHPPHGPPARRRCAERPAAWMGAAPNGKPRSRPIGTQARPLRRPGRRGWARRP